MAYGSKKLDGGHAASHPEAELFPILVSPATGKERNVIRQELTAVACWKLSDLRFDFDSSFVVAESKGEFTELAELRKSHPGSPLSIFGHADPTGDEGYNKTLSGRRAEAVYAVLLHDADRWEKLYKNPSGGDQWGLRQTQMMLTALGFDTGGTNGTPSSQSTEAIKEFQRSKELKDDGDPGPKTRAKLFAAYMAFLFPVAITEADFLGRGADGGGKADYQGCSEFNAVMVFSKDENTELQKPQNKAQRDEENTVNRRVMALLFRPGVTVPLDKWPCPRAGEGTAGCKKRFWSDHAKRRENQEARREFATTKDTFACRFYHRLADSSPCEGVVVPVTNPNTITLTLDTPFFVPELEEVTIGYTITGPLSHIVKLEVVVRQQADPKKEAARFPIPPPYAATGSLPWKGDQVTDTDLDGLLSLMKSPYEVQLILTDNGGNARESNKEKLEILPHSVEIKVDLPAGLTLSDADRKAVTELKTALDGGSDPRLIMDSTLFKTASSQMNDDTCTDLLENQWKMGPQVPLFAKVLLKGKDGTGKRNVKALHGAKLLWEMRLPTDAEESAEMDARSVHAAAKTFITTVSAFKKDDSEPKGRTGHDHLRGAREKQAAREAASKNQWKQLDAKWAMTKPAARTWDAHTTCGAASFGDYDSGVFFLPGHLAGDMHYLSAYEDHDAAFDSTDNAKLTGAAAERKSAEIHMTNWRRILIDQNLYIGAATTPLALADLDEYRKAAVMFEARPGMVAEEVQAKWKVAYQNAVKTIGALDPFVTAACLDDPGLYAVGYKSFNDYKAARQAAGGSGADLFGANTEADYKIVCDNKADSIYLETAKAFAFKGPGMVLFRFTKFGAHNMVGNVATTGLAPAIDGYTDRTHGAFFVFKNGNVKGTFIHEVGHTVFLAHAKGHFNNPTNADEGDQPAGWQKDAHDEGEFCVMSYHGTKPTNLCGLCQLKLRGWDYMKIDRKGVVA